MAITKDDHDCIIIGNRRYDNSLIYKCTKCGKSGIGLLGACGPASGPRGRKVKKTGGK